MILKIQTTLDDGGKYFLAYNSDRSLVINALTVDHVRKWLKGRPKAYFECKVQVISGIPELPNQCALEILEEVKYLNW